MTDSNQRANGSDACVDDDLIDVAFEIMLEDVISALNLYFSRFRRRMQIARVFGAVLVVLAFFSAMIGDWAPATIFLVVGVIFILPPSVLIPLFARLAMGRVPVEYRRARWRVSRNSAEVVAAGLSSHIETVADVQANASVALVFNGPRMFSLIPARACASPEEFGRLVARLEGFIGHEGDQTQQAQPAVESNRSIVTARAEIMTRDLRHHVWRHICRSVVMVIAMGFSASFAGFAIYRYLSGGVVEATACVGGAIILAAYPYLWSSISAIRMKRRTPGLNAPITFGFTPEEISIETTVGDTTLQSVDRIIQGRDSFSLYYQQSVGYTIPRRAFATQEEYERAIRLVEGLVRAKR